jgi:fatty-acyl-CoA synthase
MREVYREDSRRAWYGSHLVTRRSDANSKSARQAWLRALERTAAIDREPELTLPLLVDHWAARDPAASALAGPGGSLRYAELAERAHRYARWGLAQDLSSGDVVALFMGNRADYLAAWLGLTRLGVTVALVNTQLVGEPLAHCLRVVAAKLVVVGGELAATLASIRAQLPKDTAVWVDGVDAPADARADAALAFALEPALARVSAERVTPAECALPTQDGTALYIYTSGTTGLPKAAKVSHYRLLQWSHWFAGLLDVQSHDRMYDCLPLYHSVGGVVATGATLVGGGTVEIRARFSASDFWRDVRDSRCTLFQYIGELPRYLVNSPPAAGDTEHGLRIACGNGLRPDVWRTFQERFRIPRILEYYASTEGNFSLYNCEGEPGSIGRIPAFLTGRLRVELLRFDVEKGEPVRNAEGLCEPCAENEVGEAVGLVPEDTGRGGRFEGYEDAEATARKLLHDVLAPGDTWYRTGDLMRRDARGFYYFVDRIGDTYRWKGENVSTADVASILAALPGVVEGVVYGVKVPGTDGRAGMAALVVNAAFELAHFRAALAGRLPAYARPVFLRLLPRLEATGTFKTQKQALLREAFDPSATADPLYVDDPRSASYRRIDAELYAQISAGSLRL